MDPRIVPFPFLLKIRRSLVEVGPRHGRQPHTQLFAFRKANVIHPFPAPFATSCTSRSPADAGRYHMDIYPRQGVSSTMHTTMAFKRASGCTTPSPDGTATSTNSARVPTAPPASPH
ncbi:1038_t:CDS:2 [Scutellospora calospora]|uniref:1038_t:CDS:1 n=1 Tax=Scutellospora calospora TaxID=85575 RepID=A0ACA9MZW8_9GLOM|nr:1038_t:CDS:2 [Scutellospora calospora]